jgi:UDP-N-acetylmuramyl pentapeptide phosphotransferase/UDP-N-acetylglucosamine-1-phosphate transferase
MKIFAVLIVAIFAAYLLPNHIRGPIMLALAILAGSVLGFTLRNKV